LLIEDEGRIVLDRILRRLPGPEPWSSHSALEEEMRRRAEFVIDQQVRHIARRRQREIVVLLEAAVTADRPAAAIADSPEIARTGCVIGEGVGRVADVEGAGIVDPVEADVRRVDEGGPFGSGLEIVFRPLLA
jgi:hypothetical protein